MKAKAIRLLRAMRYSLILFFCGAAAHLPGQVTVSLDLVASGFDSPTDLAFTGDGRVFVCERAGLIRIVMPDGTILDPPFLNITDSVKSCGGNCEVGLMGMAFDPDFATNGYFYVTYTSRIDWGANPWNATMRLSRFKVNPLNPNQADKASETIVMEVYEPFLNHNGGCVRFGPDGYLYVGWGDGGFADVDHPDPYYNAQNTQKLLGKILRIDVSQLPYTIPPDNPFVGDSTVLDEIWALGVRNPWKFSFDRETGDFWMGDVQHEAQEEIDYVPADSTGGQNFGWKCYEGNLVFDTTGCPPVTGTLTFPVHTYNHFGDDICFSVTGGAVYRGPASDLYGYYVYGDYCREFIGGLKPDGQGGWISDTLAFTPNIYISTIAESPDHDLYLLHFGYGNPGTGKLYKITTPCMSFSAQAGVTDSIGCANVCTGRVLVTAATSNGADFALDWAGTTYDFADSVEIESLCPGTYPFVVTDSLGCSLADSIVLTAAFPAPVVEVDSAGDLLRVTVDSFAAYQWLQDGDTIPGATGPELMPQDTAYYSVMVTDANGCTAVSDSIKFSPLMAAIGLEAGVRLSVRPNPTTGPLAVVVRSPAPKTLYLSVWDAAGRLRQRFPPVRVAGDKTIPLDLRAYAGQSVWLVCRLGARQWVHQVFVR